MRKINGKEGNDTAKKKIGAYITLDGEKEYRAAVTACNKSLATMRSEMKLVEAQTAGSANTLDTLKKKHETLSKTLEENEKKEEEIRAGLAHAEQDYKRVGKELNEYREKLEKARNALNEMKQSSDAAKEELKKQEDTVKSLTSIVEKGEQTYQKAGSRVQDWEKQLNNAEAQTIKTTKALNENAVYMREAEDAADGCAKSIDEFGKQTNTLADEITSTGKIIKANLINTMVDAGKNLAGDVFRTAVEGTLELQDAQVKLQASTGQTAEETKKYSKEMKAAYTEGFGDDIRSVADAMALVKQNTQETDSRKIRELAENGMMLEGVFNIDLSESIRGADALMTNMGLNGQQAFDLIAKGAQNGLNKSGELGDNLAEYTALWAQAGFSAEEMFAILQNGLDSGAYNLDKVNDYVKEFGISLSDGRIESNLSAFSKNTQQLFAEWKNGEATTKQVFQSVISDLANMENQQQALTIASNTWSAVGEDNSMKVITSLNNVNNEYKNVKGTMDEIKNLNFDTVSNQWKVLGRTFQTDVMQPILVKFLPAAQKGMKVLAENIDTIVPIATTAGTAIGTMFVVNKSRKFISEVKDTGKSISELVGKITKHTAAKTADAAAETASAAATATSTAATAAQTAATTAQTGATTAQTAAQTLLNKAMMANPIGLAIAGATALVGVTALIAVNTETAKSKVYELGEESKKLQKELEGALSELENSTSKINTSMQEVSASGTLAKDLVNELDKLEGQSGKTASEQERMQMIVAQLNTMFPEMGLAIDEVTGKLNMSSAEMKNYVDSAIEMQKVQVAQEKMKESVEKLVDAEVARNEVKLKSKSIDEEIAKISQKREEAEKAIAKQNEESRKAQEEYSEALKNGAENSEELYQKTLQQSEATIEYNGQIMTATEAIRQMAEDESALKEKKDASKESIDAANKSIEKANETMAPYTEYLQGITDKTNENTESMKANSEEKKKSNETAQASIETAGRELESYKALSAAQQDLAVNVTNAVLTMQENVQGALESQMNMFEQFDGGVQISTQQLLANMQSQVDGVTNWERNLSTLADKGINQGILQKLAEMGPQGSGYVTAFNNMTSEEIAKANALWDESLDIKSMTNDWGQQLLTSGAANIAGGMQNLTPIMQASGANTVMGLVQGMQGAQKTAAAAGMDLGVKTIESVNRGLGCASPSRKTNESGKNTTQGLVLGMNSGKSNVQMTAQGIANSVITKIGTTLKRQTFVIYGMNVSTGLASGIRSGKSTVINAATEVARAAVRTAKDELEIHSPSHVFRGMGENTMDSFALGVKEKQKNVKKTVTNAVNFKNMEGKIDSKSGTAGIDQYRMIKQIIEDAARKIKFTAYLNGREITRELSRMGVVFNAKI